MKTNEELNALKEEVETVSMKLQELTEEELVQVAGGLRKLCGDDDCKNCHDTTCPRCGH